MADALVSGTSGAIHGGSSPLERTFCKAGSFEELATSSGKSDRSSARQISPPFAGFYALFYALFPRGKPIFLAPALEVPFNCQPFNPIGRERAPPPRGQNTGYVGCWRHRRLLSQRKHRRFEARAQGSAKLDNLWGVARSPSISPASIHVPRWVRKEVVCPALGLGGRTLDHWMARHRMLYRKFPTKNPRNGLVLFPAQWLVGLTGPIEIDVTTEMEDGEPVVCREVLTGTVELSGKVSVSQLARIHSVCGNTIRQWVKNDWIKAVVLPSGHLRFHAPAV